jgi:tryptophanyl-tRNA synthetase
VLEAVLAPIRARRRELGEDSGAIETLLRAGTARTRTIAAGVLRDVRDVFGLDFASRVR